MDPIFCPDDVVALEGDLNTLAVIERTHQDVDTHEPDVLRTEQYDMMCGQGVGAEAFRKFTRTGVPPKGTVFIRPLGLPNGMLIVESKLTLIDRSLLIGDVVKKGVNNAISGVVLNTFATCMLRPLSNVHYGERLVLKGLVPPSELKANFSVDALAPQSCISAPASELEDADSPTEEDLVIYKDWIGRVEGVHSRIVLMLADKCVVEIADELATHADGAVDYFKPGDIALTKKGHLRNGTWVYGSYNANTPPVGTVVRTRPVAVQVGWLERRIGCLDETEPPFELERDELESPHFRIYNRTRRPANQSAADRTISNSEMDIRLGMRVRFKDLTAACAKYDGSAENGKLEKIDRQETLGYDINVYDVVKFNTDVVVQWQDLSITVEDSIKLIPDNSIDDEHVAWPGEIAHSLDDTGHKVGVIHAVNAEERMAEIQWCPDGFVHAGRTDDGQRETTISLVGVAKGDTESVSLYDLEAPAAINVRRGDIVLIANKAWIDPNLRPTAEEKDWIGEIVDTRLDGQLTVRLGIANEVQDVVLPREHVVVAVRSDGAAELDAWDANDETGYGDSPDDSDDGSEDETLSDYDEGQATYEDENGHLLNEEDVENEDWESAEGDSQDRDEDVEMVDASEGPQDSSTPLAHDQSTATAQPAVEKSVAQDTPEPYAILDTPVPTSHHYHTTASHPNPAQMKRTAQEHKILRAPFTLPPGVFVRTWESRLDLLRILLIGPSETPYADAPFIVDIHLPPQFPMEPPQAHFHSWQGEAGLGGVGRVNPNLYEDGKICLSLLGTWEGSKGEGWSAARSTLLQVIVSLLGLVLVKEPYFNEAGYEHLVGLEASRRPSALYSERTYLRARTFVITALARLGCATGREGIEGFEDVLQALYKTPTGPRLVDKVVQDMEKVLQRSEEGAEGKELDGLTIMSKGACIPLRRVMERLGQFQ